MGWDFKLTRKCHMISSLRRKIKTKNMLTRAGFETIVALLGQISSSCRRLATFLSQ